MTEIIVLEKAPPAASFNPEPIAKRKRVFIFVTRSGFVFITMLVVMLLAAVNYTNSMAYLVTFLLVSIFLICMLHTYRNLAGLIITTDSGSPVFCGEKAYFPMFFDNRGGPPRVGITLLRAKVRRHGNGAAEVWAIDIAADGFSREELSLPTERRGTIKLPRLRIQSTFPLGLFRAWSYIEATADCVVYPAPLGNRNPPENTTTNAEDFSGQRNGSDDFVGFRRYRPGDSTRSIDWKAYARQQGLLIKRFTGAGARKIVLRWSHTPEQWHVEKRLSQLCIWVLQADRQGMVYGMELPDINIDSDHGPEHRQRCLTALALYGLEE